MVKDCRLHPLDQRRRSRGWGRQDFEAKAFGNFHHARNVLLLLRGQSGYRLEESFETRRRNHAHLSSGCWAKVTVGVWDTTWREDGRTLLSDEFLIANGPFIFAFENLKGLILSVMNMRWRAATGHIVRFHRAHNAVGGASMKADYHGNARNVDFPAAFGRYLNWLHKRLLPTYSGTTLTALKA